MKRKEHLSIKRHIDSVLPINSIKRASTKQTREYVKYSNTLDLQPTNALSILRKIIKLKIQTLSVYPHSNAMTIYRCDVSIQQEQNQHSSKMKT